MSETLEKNALKKIHELAYGKKDCRKELNVFKVLKNADHEIRHSSFLAWLFDPEENHGFGSEFAVEFFYNAFKVKMLTEKLKNLTDEESEAEDQIIKDWKKFKDKEFNVEGYTISDWSERFSIENFNGLHCKNDKPDTYIDTEVPARSYDKNASIEESRKGRIDIFVKGADFTCTIENKTYSVEHDDQLKTYKDFINNKYKKDKGYTNFFIYLGITKPKDFYAENSVTENHYYGYIYVSYKIVINILNDLLDKDKAVGKIDGEVKNFIKQYLVVLNEYYGNLDQDTANLCDEILKDNALAEEILEYEDNKLSAKLKNGKSVLSRYAVHLQRDINDLFIQERLREIIKEGHGHVREGKKGIISYHAGTSSKADPYATTIILENCIRDFFARKEVFAETRDTLRKYLNQIDYRAKLGIFSMLFHYGSDKDKSTACMKYICDNKESFCESIESLAKENWNILLILRVYSGGKQSEAVEFKDLPLEIIIDSKSKANDIFGKISDYDKNDFCIDTHKKSDLIKSDGSANETSPVFEMVEKVFQDKYADLKNGVKGYFERTTKEKVPYKELNIRWQLDLTYNFFNEPIITKEDREKIKKSIGEKFYEKTIKGLELFGLDKPFIGTIFINPKNDSE